MVPAASLELLEQIKSCEVVSTDEQLTFGNMEDRSDSMVSCSLRACESLRSETNTDEY